MFYKQEHCIDFFVVCKFAYGTIYFNQRYKAQDYQYNPYNLETEITVEGKKLAQNSKIGERILPGTRLQEWIEDLPRILIDEYNDRDFDVDFHGTLLDFEDLIK